MKWVIIPISNDARERIRVVINYCCGIPTYLRPIFLQSSDRFSRAILNKEAAQRAAYALPVSGFSKQPFELLRGRRGEPLWPRVGLV